MSADSSERRSFDPEFSGDESLAAIDRLLRRDASSVTPPAGLSRRVFDKSVSHLPARRFRFDRRRPAPLAGAQPWWRLAMAATIALAFIWSWSYFAPQSRGPSSVVPKPSGVPTARVRTASLSGDADVMAAPVEAWLFRNDDAVQIVASRSIMSVDDLGFSELDAELGM